MERLRKMSGIEKVRYIEMLFELVISMILFAYSYITITLCA